MIKNDSPQELFNSIYKFMYYKGGKLNPITRKSSIETYFENLNLSIDIRIFSSEKGNLIVEFQKLEGDKEEFVEIFENFKEFI